MAAWLAARGVDVNLAAINKTTPLMAAAFAGRADIMRLLLDAGADASREDQVFKTAMVYAAAEGHVEAVTLLLERGVEVNHLYAHNLTALMWAAGYGKSECVRLLLDRGADPRLKDDRGKTARDIAQEQGFGETATLLPGGA
jgi:ankyrin repeat protein